MMMYVTAVIVAIAVIYCGAYFLHGRRVYCQVKRDLTGLTALITGGSSGIGRATAVELAKRGARVIIASRHRGRGEAAMHHIRGLTGNTEVLWLYLDLSDLATVRSFASYILQTELRLHILINNAAISNDIELRTKDGYDRVFTVNYLGHFLLTNLLADLLKKSAPSRVINVSSISHMFASHDLHLSIQNDQYGDTMFPALRGYDISKLAQILYTKQLAWRLAEAGVTVHALNPGVCLTNLWDQVRLHWGWILATTLKIIIWPLSMDAEAAAQTTVYCAVSPDLVSQTGRYYSKCRLTKDAVQARHKQLSQELWDASLLLTGCKSDGDMVAPLEHLQCHLENEAYNWKKQGYDPILGYAKPTKIPENVFPMERD